MATTISFISVRPLSLNVYFDKDVYKHINFHSDSKGKGYYNTKELRVAKALTRTYEYCNGIIKLERPSDIKLIETPSAKRLVMPKAAPKVVNIAPKATEEVNETPEEVVNEVEDDVEEEVNETPDTKTENDGLETVEFPDIAEATLFLVDKGCKKSELRSTKAVKEKGELLGYNIVITD